MTGPNYGRRSKALGSKDPRVTRNAQAQTQDGKYLLPIKRERDGTVSLVLSSVGPLAIDPERGLYLRVAAPLKVQSHSPFALSIESVETDPQGNMVLVLSTQQVKDASGTTVQTLIDRLQANKENKIEKGVANGYAPLDGSGLVPTANLPPSGSGDVVGPASATDSHVAQFDGITGKLLKDGGLTLSGTNTGDQTITLTGNVTGSGTGTFGTTISAGAVTLAMQANMATASLVYRKTAGSGAPEVNTLATVKTDLGLTGTNSGDQTISLTGEVTGSGTGSFAATIANSAVTLAKMANLAQDQFIGRTTASTGVPQTATITAAARTVLDDTTVAAMRATLGAGDASGPAGAVNLNIAIFDGTTGKLIKDSGQSLAAFPTLDGNSFLDAAEIPNETGTDSLSAGGATVVPSNLLTLGYTCNVLVSRNLTVSGVAGQLYVDPSLTTGTDFTVQSTNPTDKCDFTWLVVAHP